MRAGSPVASWDCHKLMYPASKQDEVGWTYAGNYLTSTFE